MSRNHKGFGIIEITFVVAVLAIGGLLGYKALEILSKSNTVSTVNTSAQTQQVNTDQAPAINGASDLDKSASTLDATNIDGTEADQLNTETTF